MSTHDRLGPLRRPIERVLWWEPRRRGHTTGTVDIRRTLTEFTRSAFGEVTIAIEDGAEAAIICRESPGDACLRRRGLLAFWDRLSVRTSM